MYRGLHVSSSGAGAATAMARYATRPGDMMDVEFAQLSDLGRVRQGNEDYLGYVAADTPEKARHDGWLFVLCDGVGGHDLGEVASKTAVESVLEGFRKSQAGELHPGLLTSLVRTANMRVLEAGHAANPAGSRMATTIVACALRHDRATVAHVGDSRCYLIRRGEATLLTRDHTLANEHVRLGLISAADASTAETRHLLSRSLGLRALRQRRRERASGACRRRSSPLLRRSPRLRARLRNGRRRRQWRRLVESSATPRGYCQSARRW